MPTVISPQTGLARWLDIPPDLVAADSIVNRSANDGREISPEGIHIRLQGQLKTQFRKDDWMTVEKQPANETTNIGIRRTDLTI